MWYLDAHGLQKTLRARALYSAGTPTTFPETCIRRCATTRVGSAMVGREVRWLCESAGQCSNGHHLLVFFRPRLRYEMQNYLRTAQKRTWMVEGREKRWYLGWTVKLSFIWLFSCFSLLHELLAPYRRTAGWAAPLRVLCYFSATDVRKRDKSKISSCLCGHRVGIIHVRCCWAKPQGENALRKRRL